MISLPFFYALISVLWVSLIAFIWILALGIKQDTLKKILIYFVSFSAWALLWDVAIHLLPEISEMSWFTIGVSLALLWWILFWLITEKIIHWTHCHMPITKQHVHPFALMNLVGDMVHNFIDGIIIWASYLVSIPLGIATTLAVIFHEIPQEIWDFWVLLHGWFTKKKALIINFITALTAFLWVILTFWIGSLITSITPLLLAFAAGSFIYIAWADLIPELHKEVWTKKALRQISTFVAGIGVMMCLLFIE